MRYLIPFLTLALCACGSNVAACGDEDETLVVVRTTVSDPIEHWCSYYSCVASTTPTYAVVVRDKHGVDRLCYINKVTAEALQPNQRVTLPEAQREF